MKINSTPKLSIVYRDIDIAFISAFGDFTFALKDRIYRDKDFENVLKIIDAYEQGKEEGNKVGNHN